MAVLCERVQGVPFLLTGRRPQAGQRLYMNASAGVGGGGWGDTCLHPAHPSPKNLKLSRTLHRGCRSLLITACLTRRPTAAGHTV